MNKYKPEGINWEVKSENTIERLNKAMRNGDILESKVIKSDENLNLYLDLCDDAIAIIAYNDIEYNFNSNKTKSVAIMSKVGKTVRFKIKDIEGGKDKYIVHCSRADAQKECYDEYISKLVPGDIVQAHVTHIENYGIFCDIGGGLVALLPIENVSITRITNPKHTLRTWKDLYAVVKYIDKDGKITLTHKELLGTWEEESSKFNIGETVAGVVKTIEDYGIFISLTQNLSGLAELDKTVHIEDNVNVYIKDINKETMKIKLAIVSSETPDPDYINKIRFTYTKKHGHIDEWRYSPECCRKYIGTKFSE